ncbi:hypothetical protein DEU56DRAFT_811640 [Suillus clintonianus]|uniref:uncharacterized protein n=1 Tax=Suillus clintonianus TaxID=1904413 RepID=UPI001B87A91D|nr:uncharacterized protein DEU56DRAFT_811640 [Suillus clintonianus]KAG2132981.1 hypothetical protein DEU56DRAFT_811640 [Suillus clintonianus]
MVPEELLSTLRQEVCALESRRKDLLARLEETTTSLVEVQSLLTRKTVQAHTIQNLLAPVSRLPDEVLLAIFEEAVRTQEQGQITRTEIAISCTSHHWRQIAVNAPRLWNSLCIRAEVPVAVSQIYISRSASIPLTVEFREREAAWPGADKRSMAHLGCALDAIMPSVPRWRRIVVLHRSYPYFTHVFRELRKAPPLKMLQSISMRSPGVCGPCPLLLGESAPALESLEVEDMPLPPPVTQTFDAARYSVAGLTTLRLRVRGMGAGSSHAATDPSAFRALIGSAPMLSTLEIYGQPINFGQERVNDEDILPLEIPRLRTLVLHPNTQYPRDLRHFISVIKAPTLRHFELVYPDNAPPGQDVSDLLFDPFPLTRFPCVETVRLHKAVNADTISAFMSAFPVATRIKLGNSDASWLFGDLTSNNTRSSRTSSHIQHLTVISPLHNTLLQMYKWLLGATSQAHRLPIITLEGPIRVLDCPEFLTQFSKLASCTEVRLCGVDLSTLG